MKVEADAVYRTAGLHSKPARASSGDFASMVTSGAASPDGASAGKGGGARPEFTRMTRQELFDWMNGQILSGNMSLEESTPFLSMTVKVSVASGQTVDMATDTERIDFVDRARRGIAFALSHFDRENAERLQKALQIMQRA